MGSNRVPGWMTLHIQTEKDGVVHTRIKADLRKAVSCERLLNRRYVTGTIDALTDHTGTLAGTAVGNKVT